MSPFPKYLLLVFEVKIMEGVVVALPDGLELPLALVLDVLIAVLMC
jgi:hypothetical protein